MRLFRQRQHGDWSGVVEDLRHAFEDLTLLDFSALATASCPSMKSFHQPLSDPDLLSLVRRMELEPKLLRRHLEEQIIALVPLEESWLEETRSSFLNGRPQEECLQEKGWTCADLELHLRRPEALRRFAHQRFGPGLEERFLASKGSRDLVIYSMLRVKDYSLARELWIRLEEDETTFAEAAREFGVGPEADGRVSSVRFRLGRYSLHCFRTFFVV